ncbi:MAG: iron ABC transporter permease [Chloroflexota bacterium]|nr:iron ABC transporter permease [Chloroflexota bacterium]
MAQVSTAHSNRVTLSAFGRRNGGLHFWLVGLLLILGISVTLGVSLGPVPIPAGDVWGIAAAKVGLRQGGTWSTAHENIVWLIRFPRVLLAVFVGGRLAVVGVTLQALVRNGLADPYLLGITSGASVGAVLAIGLGVFAFAGVYGVSVGAFAGALLAFVVVFVMAQRRGRITPQRLVLAGVAVAYVFGGVTSFVTITAENRLLAGQVLSWTLGSLVRASWADLTLPALTLLIGSLYLALQARPLNALLMGDESATGLGVDVVRLRRRLFVVTSLLTSVLVAVSGSIGFIGLMIPHLVRLFVGSDHRRVLPVALLVGSIFLVWVDVIARTAFAPTELPVGVITALLGGPFFLWLLWRQNG